VCMAVSLYKCVVKECPNPRIVTHRETGYCYDCESSVVADYCTAYLCIHHGDPFSCNPFPMADGGDGHDLSPVCEKYELKTDANKEDGGR
jgi:hypothetical protein